MRLRGERSQQLCRIKGQKAHNCKAATGSKQKNKQEKMTKKEKKQNERRVLCKAAPFGSALEERRTEGQKT